YNGTVVLKKIAKRINDMNNLLNNALHNLCFIQKNEVFFDALAVEAKGNLNAIKKSALAEEMNFHYNKDTIGISLDETTTYQDVKRIINVFAEVAGKTVGIDTL